MSAPVLIKNNTSSTGAPLKASKPEKLSEVAYTLQNRAESYYMLRVTGESHSITGSIKIMLVIVADQPSRSNAEWDKILASPESIAYEKKVRAKIENDIATGAVKNYISDDDLEELF